MAIITMGNTAENRPWQFGGNMTIVDHNTAAAQAGTITSAQVFTNVGATGSTVKLGIFYVVSGNNLTCRSATGNLGNLAVGLNTFNGLTLAVQPGDFIGLFVAAAGFRLDTTDATGACWYKNLDQTACVNTAFTAYAGTVSIYGTGITSVVTPSITSFTPNHGVRGSTVTIAGTDFIAAQGTGSVTFDGQTADIVSWADLEIVCRVPLAASLGVINVVVTNNDTESDTDTFTVDRPTITEVYPASGAIGSTVTITGLYFGATEGLVLFNGAVASVSAWAAGSITCSVPSLATTGSVIVVDAYGNPSNSGTLTVTNVPPSQTGDGNTGDPDAWEDFYACIYLAQFWVQTETIRALAVKGKKGRVNSPGTVTFEIYRADAAGKPVGAMLASGTNDADTWSTDDTGLWIIVPVSPHAILLPGQRYVLIWYAAAGDAGNKGRSKKQTPGEYTGGYSLSSADCGTNWTEILAEDFLFEVIGERLDPSAKLGTGTAGQGPVRAGARLGNPPVAE